MGRALLAGQGAVSPHLYPLHPLPRWPSQARCFGGWGGGEDVDAATTPASPWWAPAATIAAETDTPVRLCPFPADATPPSVPPRYDAAAAAVEPAAATTADRRSRRRGRGKGTPPFRLMSAAGDASARGRAGQMRAWRSRRSRGAPTGRGRMEKKRGMTVLIALVGRLPTHRSGDGGAAKAVRPAPRRRLMATPMPRWWMVRTQVDAI